ncbi:amidohydrolase [Timonella senegalensis]|uniref:amidohydrolase n=1 Tax=Timonella senegalensis TaxID=1465825 RepID=UPI0003103015|nr:amidohydrolase [Timonella senegalensis]
MTFTQATRIQELLESLEPELIEIRRDIHAHPEVARTERRTTALVAERLRQEGLEPRLLKGSGLTCDIGPSIEESGVELLALRADIDALPLQETTGLPFASESEGKCHACGHDVHTTVVLGTGIVLARLAREGKLKRGVRLIFQPAEEVQPGGALDLLAQDVLDDVSQIYAVHCEPKIDAGTIGTRIGPITSACDTVTVTVTSAGGHTSRPHLTGDVVYAIGRMIAEVPSVLGRRLDPRAGVNFTWGHVQAGSAPNAMPSSGIIAGTLRCLDVNAWERAGQVLHDTIEHIAAAYGVDVTMHHQRGVPPVVNDEDCTLNFEAAARDALGPSAAVLTEQSLGGEDFAWYLTKVPGALARLGTRTPGGETYDLHRGDLVVDERAISAGVAMLARVASGE